MARLLDLPDARVEIAVVGDPSPAHALYELADAHDAGLVIVGRTRFGPAGRIYPGATPERLRHGISRPLAVVPEGFRQQGEPRRLGVAYADTPEGVAALAAATSVARALDALLELIAIVPGADARRTDERLAELVDSLSPGVRAEAVRLGGDP